MKLGAGIISLAVLLYSRAIEKGVFGMVRLKKDNTVQTHIDWDCEEYDEVFANAQKVKKGQKSGPTTTKE